MEVAQEYSSDRKLPAVAFKPLGEVCELLYFNSKLSINRLR